MCNAICRKGKITREVVIKILRSMYFFVYFSSLHMQCVALFILLFIYGWSYIVDL